MFNNQIIAGSSGQGGGSFYETTIDQSLRLNGVDSNLARTHTAGDSQKFTWAGWVKFANDNIFSLFETFAGGTDFTQFTLQTSGTINFYHIAGAVDYGGDTTQRLRDPSAWYHIVFRVDTTQASAGDRVRIYVNGTQFETNPFTNYGSIPQNTNTFINTARAHRMGYNQNVGGGGAPTTQANAFGNGYLAEVHFCDGQSYAPTEFGETNNGIWVPITPSVTYGTNGFHLAFSDTSAIGDDTSGQGNDWTVDDIAASDIVPDSPTNNFAVWNYFGGQYGGTNKPAVSEGSLKAATAGNPTHTFSTFAINPTDTQGYYWEAKAISLDTARSYMGIVGLESDPGTATAASYTYNFKFVLSMNGSLFANNNTSATGTVALTSWTTNDILMFAYKDGKFWIGKNGTWMNSGDPAAGTGDLVAQDGGRPSDRGNVTWYPYVGYNSTYIGNFGQDSTFAGTETAGGNSDENGYGDFKYSVPSGFLAMCAANLPEPEIGPNSGVGENSTDYFEVALFTGNGSTNDVSSLSFQPDWTVISDRNYSGAHNRQMMDVCRSGNKLRIDDSAGDSSGPTGFSFTSDGFDIGADSLSNANTVNYTSWNWKAGGSSNTFNIDGTGYSSVSASPISDGTIALTGLSVNTKAGVSVGTYTGTGSNGTVAHGLDGTPDYICTKSRNSSLSWYIYAPDALSLNYVLAYNATNAQFASAGAFIEGDINSTTFGVGTETPTNKSGDSFHFHCLKSVEGFSKVGKFTGRGVDTFVYCGFRPAFVMIKNIDTSTHHWVLYDNKRDTFNNNSENYTYWNLASAEATAQRVDFVSNGFVGKINNYDISQAAVQFLYMAFAEQPFKYANAR